MKKITFLTDSYYPSVGGAQRLIQTLAEELSKKDFVINVITRRIPKTKSYEKINNVNVFRIKSFRYFFEPLILIHSITNNKIREVIVNSDILQGFGYFTARAVYLLSKLFKKKGIITVYEYIGKKWLKLLGIKGILNYLYERSIFFFHYDWIITISHSTMNDLKEITKSNIKVIYPFIDTNLFRPIPKKNTRTKIFTFIYYGRPGITKGIDYLIKAFHQLSQENQRIRLKLILADKPEKNKKKLLNLLNKLKNPRIILDKSKPINELIKEINHADCVVVPSLTEGFGYTAAEASALKKPIVATTAGSLPEVILNEKTGILVKPFSVRELYLGMKRILNDKNRDFFGSNGREYIKKFNKQETINNHLRIYQNLI